MKRKLIPILGILLLLAGCRHATSPDPNDDSARPSGRTYSVKVGSISHGAIIAKPASAVAGTEIVLQVNPEAGYKLVKDSLKIKGPMGEPALGEGVRSFTLPEGNVEVTGEFEELPQNTYSVSFVSDGGKRGTVIPYPEFGAEGTLVHLTVIPDEGFRYVPGSLKTEDMVVNDLSRTFALPNKDIKVSADFEALSSGSYTIRVNTTTNGQIFARPETGTEGAEIFLQVIPDPGYVLKSGSLKYGHMNKSTPVDESHRTIIMPKGHIFVSGEFEQVPSSNYSIRIENLANGRIFTESKYGTAGTRIALQIYPDAGYFLKEGSLKYKTSSSEADINDADLSNIFFDMPADNVVIYGEFIPLEKDNFSVQVGRFDYGKITPYPEYGKKDTNIYLRVRPDAGYQLKAGSLYYVDSSGTETPVNEGQSFILPASHVRIKAEFEPLAANIYLISEGNMSNGHIISIPGSGKESTPITLWVQPDPGYSYKKGSLKYKLIPSNAEFQVPDNKRTFKLNASNAEVWAEFVKIPTNSFTVQVSPAEHGMIYPKQDNGSSGQRIEMVILPDPGYQIKPGSLQYKDSNNIVKKFNGTDTNFKLPQDHVVVSGEFEAIKYTANVDTSIRNGTITISPQQGTIGTLVTLEIKPKNGYRLTPNSLKYRIVRSGQETAINESIQRFTMPPENITIMAKFEPYSALGDLKVNGRPVKGLTNGKTGYTVWIPQQEDKATITFTTLADISVSPGSGEVVSLDALEKKDVVFKVSTQEGKVTTDYTITVIRELIPTKAVPAGSFQREDNINSISIVSAFRMGEREVTQEEWNRVMSFPRGAEGGNMPAHSLSWYEAVMFCNKLSMLEGKTPVYMVNNTTDPDKWGQIPDLGNNRSWNVSSRWDADGYRLPTEMEWHWAAMGADSRLPGKPNTGGYLYQFTGFAEPGALLDDAAWYAGNSSSSIHEVAGKKPNELGLYDMSGNVMEWCWDWVNDNYQKSYSLNGRQTNFHGGDNNTGSKMRRGGSYLNSEAALYLNYRGNENNAPQDSTWAVRDPRVNDDYAGLRIVYRD